MLLKRFMTSRHNDLVRSHLNSECQKESNNMTLALGLAGHRLGIEGTGVEAKRGTLGVRVMRCMDG